MTTVLGRNWWALAIRGVLAILFGLIAFLNPGLTLAAVVLLFGAYAVVGGVFTIVAGVRAAERHEASSNVASRIARPKSSRRRRRAGPLI